MRAKTILLDSIERYELTLRCLLFAFLLGSYGYALPTYDQNCAIWNSGLRASGVAQGVLFDKATWQEFFDGLMLGGLVGTAIMAVELLALPSRYFQWIRNLPLGEFFLIRLGIWCAVISGIATIIGPLIDDPEWLATSTMSLVLSVIAVAFFMMQRLVGHHTLLNLLTGWFYHPQRRDYVFLFIDLKGSTRIAERIGHQKFFSLLNRCG